MQLVSIMEHGKADALCRGQAVDAGAKREGMAWPGLGRQHQGGQTGTSGRLLQLPCASRSDRGEKQGGEAK